MRGAGRVAAPQLVKAYFIQVFLQKEQVFTESRNNSIRLEVQGRSKVSGSGRGQGLTKPFETLLIVYSKPTPWQVKGGGGDSSATDLNNMTV